MLVKTEAIVLKSMNYRDTSKIVTFYSKKFGKVKGIAKGARTMKNKFGSSLEPLSHTMLLIYKKENRDLHLISQCDTINSFRNVSKDLERMYAALDTIGLVNQVVHHEEQNAHLFKLLLQMLDTLDSDKTNYGTYLMAFRLRLASLFGYMPDFNSCKNCGGNMLAEKKGEKVTFKIKNGAIFCDQCLHPRSSENSDKDNGFIVLSIQGLQIVRKLLDLQWPSLGNLRFDTKTGNEIDELLRLYLRYHFDGLKPLKSIEYFKHNN